MRRGAIHWAQVEKRRPAVIISPTSRNQAANDVLLLPCSSSSRPMRWHVRLEKGEAGLPTATFVKCEQINTVAKEFVEPEELGMLSDARVREIERALISALGIQD